MSYTRDMSQTLERPKAHGEVLAHLEGQVTNLLRELDEKERIDAPDEEVVWTLATKEVPQAVEVATEAVDLDTTKKLTWLVASLSEALRLERGTPQRYDGVMMSLEGIREVLTNFREGPGVWAGKDDHELVVWLLQTLPGIPQKQIAGLLGVSPKTVYRWQESGGAGDHNDRLRSLAAVVAQLRFSMTPTGIVSWLHQPQGDKKTPLQRLSSPDGMASVIRSAMELRGA